MGLRERSATIHHNYYCRSLTSIEIIGAVTGPHGMLEEWARPSQQDVNVKSRLILDPLKNIVFSQASGINLIFPSASATYC